ncbi:hypothetical protein EVAR_39334_1 [Eumeta japonica]|uniref:Uncharacterized protein n=1 Tax=Eumeta variegata TaxID=151549 RepID=A0A4C1WMV2_EUMVA|nr:hypothetical protein EVAR_39334_1 [Eumeta japonica]
MLPLTSSWLRMSAQTGRDLNTNPPARPRRPRGTRHAMFQLKIRHFSTDDYTEAGQLINLVLERIESMGFDNGHEECFGKRGRMFEICLESKRERNRNGEENYYPRLARQVRPSYAPNK